jgi:hypothetical protein
MISTSAYEKMQQTNAIVQKVIEAHITQIAKNLGLEETSSQLKFDFTGDRITPRPEYPIVSIDNIQDNAILDALKDLGCTRWCSDKRENHMDTSSISLTLGRGDWLELAGKIMGISRMGVRAAMEEVQETGTVKTTPSLYR